MEIKAIKKKRNDFTLKPFQHRTLDGNIFASMSITVCIQIYTFSLHVDFECQLNILCNVYTRFDKDDCCLMNLLLIIIIIIILRTFKRTRTHINVEVYILFEICSHPNENSSFIFSVGIVVYFNISRYIILDLNKSIFFYRLKLF